MVKKKPDEQALGEAVTELKNLLANHGVKFPLHVATEFMGDLMRAGWRHTRPSRDQILGLDERGTRVPGEHAAEVVPEYGAARDALRQETHP